MRLPGFVVDLLTEHQRRYPPGAAGLVFTSRNGGVVYRTILGSPGSARIPALHPGGLDALFQKAGRTGHHFPSRVGQMVQHVAAQVVADRVGVPADGSEEVLGA